MNNLQFILGMKYQNMTNAVNELLNIRANIWVNANAGSGKTTALVKRFLVLLLHSVRHDKILCITYTNTAAKEMQERVEKALLRWSEMDLDKLEQELIEYKLDNKFSKLEYVAIAKNLLKNIKQSGRLFKISTIHSFCFKLLKKYATYTGVNADTKIFDNFTTENFVQHVRSRLNAITKEEDEMVYNAFALLLDNKGEFFITELIRDVINNITRIEAFINAMNHEEYISLLPQEAQDCIEKEQQIEQLKEELIFKLNDTTYDKLLITLKQNKTTGSNNEEKQNNLENAIKAMLTKAGSLRKVKVDKIEDRKIASLIRDLQHYIIANEKLNQVNFCLSCFKITQFIYHEYIKFTQQNNVISYNQILQKTIDILQKPDYRFMLHDIDLQIEHVMLDEAQDTNPESWQLIDIITSEFFAGYGSRDEATRTLFVVGDVKQSIYSFQGANLIVYDRYKQLFEEKSKNAKVEFIECALQHSYRSAQQILDFVDKFCNYDAYKNAFTLHNDLEIKHVSKVEPYNSKIQYITLQTNNDSNIEQEDENNDSSANSDKYINWIDYMKITAEKKLQQKKQIISSIQKVIEQTTGEVALLVQSRTAKDYAILDVIEHLQKNLLIDLNVQEFAKYDIYLLDIFAILRFIQNPYDNFNTAVVLKSPLFGLTDRDFLIIKTQLVDGFLIDRILSIFSQDIEKNHNISIINKLQKFMQLNTKSIQRVLLELLSLFEVCAIEMRDIYIQYVKAIYQCCYENAIYGDIAIINIIDLTKIFRENIQNYLQQNKNNKKYKITFCGTVHMAKGMEFDDVILLDLSNNTATRSNGLLYYLDNNKLWFYTPSGFKFDFWSEYKNSSTNLEIMEELRLHYVAMTRAKKNFFLIANDGNCIARVFNDKIES